MNTKKIEFPKDNSPIVLIGDVIEKLEFIKKEGIKVNAIITSPPYYGQRDYGVKGQIGTEKTSEEYINNMLKVADSLKKVLTDDGCYFLNIGDKYAGKGLQLIPFRLAHKMQKKGWVLRNTIIWHKPNHMPSSLKDRLSNTWEPVFFFIKSTGKYYSQDYYHDMDKIRIEHKTKNEEKKRSSIPYELNGEEFNRLRDKPISYGKEYNGKFTQIKNKINIGASPGGRASLLKANGKTYSDFYSRQRKNEITKEKELEIIQYLRDKKKEEKISSKEIDKCFGYKDTAGHWFRLDHGRSLPKIEDWFKLKELLKLDSRYDNLMTEVKYVLQILKKHPKGKNPGDIWSMPEDDIETELWSIPTEKIKDGHFAIFPEELPKRIIKAFCPKGGIVLDPFGGSGTTGKAAFELKRKSILIDINPDYEEIMLKRIETSK